QETHPHLSRAETSRTAAAEPNSIWLQRALWGQGAGIAGSASACAEAKRQGVRIGRRHLGIHNLTVDHAASRVAGQGNSPTWLNWSSLGSEIARGNYVGWYLLLERLVN